MTLTDIRARLVADAMGIEQGARELETIDDPVAIHCRNEMLVTAQLQREAAQVIDCLDHARQQIFGVHGGPVMH